MSENTHRKYKYNSSVIISNTVFVFIAVTFLILLSLFIVIPFFSTLKNSFYQDNAVSIQGYIQLFLHPKFQSSLINSIIISGITACVSVAMGSLFAFSTRYYRLCNNTLFKIIPFIPLLSPHGTFALTSILLFEKTGVFSTFSGVHFMTDNYFFLLIITQGISFFPLSYFMLIMVFSQLPAVAEIKKSRLSKAIYYFPYLLISWILTFNCAFIDWQHPVVLNCRYDLVSTINYEQSQVFSNTIIQSTMCIFLVVVTLFLSAIVLLLLKSGYDNPSYIHTTSHVQQGHSAAGVFFFGLCLLVSLYVNLSIVTVIFGSIQKYWGIAPDFYFQHYMFSVRKLTGTGSDIFLQACITVQIILALFILWYFSKDRKNKILQVVQDKIIYFFIFIIPGTIISCGYLFGFGSNNFHFPESVFYICLGYIFYTIVNKLKYPLMINHTPGLKKQCENQ